MNLPLHFGWLGVLEAALIAFVIGILCFLAWRWLSLRLGWPESRAIGVACCCAVVIGAGIDSWNLFYLGVVRLESPLYARLALAKMHDPDFLGTRAFLEGSAALAGVVVGWILVASRNGAGDEAAAP